MGVVMGAKMLQQLPVRLQLARLQLLNKLLL